MRFVTDGMLGKLTRWLRMLGQDVEYAGSMDDKELVLKARQERRVLLTRDLELFQRATARGVEAFLVEGSTGAETLASLAQRFKLELEIDVKISRCPKCNTSIKQVSKDQILEKIPETTASNYAEFWLCPGCSKVYWRGAHWKRIARTLREAKLILDA